MDYNNMRAALRWSLKRAQQGPGGTALQRRMEEACNNLHQIVDWHEQSVACDPTGSVGGIAIRPLNVPPQQEEVTHIRRRGDSMCGHPKGRPVDWPAGHFWMECPDASTDSSEVASPTICPTCWREWLTWRTKS